MSLRVESIRLQELPTRSGWTLLSPTVLQIRAPSAKTRRTEVCLLRRVCR